VPQPPASSAEAAAGPSGDQPPPPQPEQQGDEDMEGIDPDFLAALPPELQEEVLEQHRREQQRRRAAAACEAAQEVRASLSGIAPCHMLAVRAAGVAILHADSLSLRAAVHGLSVRTHDACL
jgi:hypothetical protein